MDRKSIAQNLQPQVGPAAPVDGPASNRSDAPATKPTEFGSILQKSLGEVNKLQAEADQAVEALATGKGISLHETMIALEKADLSFRLMMQVRNKIVEAYRDVVNMQV
jgi:flagellar hook-basal body complex protein FliE